ncbi:MAG: cytochrome c biogenesis protein CcsA [Actinomycetia bacterium]|nr:cytochrome c biogenesis protein CcsA [Actinomycetes bacterium]MCP5034678.1 cytochrome c biogenesis protein CcsA [Actinomycetes bacterium]
MTTSSTTPATPEPRAPAPANTGSPATRWIGALALVGVGMTLLFGLVISGPEETQGDAARLLYIHLPTVAAAYLGFFITMVGSIIYLRNGSRFWDLLASAAAEIGVLFCALLLITGALWGKPTWGVYWQWDPRLTSTTVMFVMYIGYLAVRRLELPPDVRSRRAAVLGIVSFLNVVIVHYSVKWWRGLHQGESLGADTQIKGMILFSLLIGLVTFLAIFAWLLIHRFRVAWLSYQVDELGLARALAERRAETDATGLLGRKD